MAHTTKHSEPAPALQSSKVFWNVWLRGRPADAVGVFLLVYFPGNSHHGEGTSVVQQVSGDHRSNPANPQVEEKKHGRCENSPFFSACAFSSGQDQPC